MSLDLRRDHDRSLDALIEAERAAATREERERWEDETIRLDFGMVADGQPWITAYGEDGENRTGRPLMALIEDEVEHIEGNDDFAYGWLLAATLRRALYLIDTASENAAREAANNSDN